jgi:hypothetical protein
MNERSTYPLNANNGALPDDIIVGAEGISVALYGPEEGARETNIRRIYHAVAKGDLPTFKLGGRVHARRSTILAWIEKQEARS